MPPTPRHRRIKVWAISHVWNTAKYHSFGTFCNICTVYIVANIFHLCVQLKNLAPPSSTFSKTDFNYIWVAKLIHLWLFGIYYCVRFHEILYTKLFYKRLYLYNNGVVPDSRLLLLLLRILNLSRRSRWAFWWFAKALLPVV